MKIHEKQNSFPDLNVHKVVNDLKTVSSCDDDKKGTQWTKPMTCRSPKAYLVIISILVTILTMVAAFTLWFYPSPLETDSFLNSNVNISQSSTYSKVESSNSTSNVFEDILVTRSGWLAQPPLGNINNLKTPIHLIIIHHTATSSCLKAAECVDMVRIIQIFHIESRGWNEIGYNFLIGGDGRIYEGRGWAKEGAHTIGSNFKSLGIGFIGTFTAEAPPEKQINPLNVLLKKGVELGYIADDYVIKAARQFSGSTSPGQAFYQLIQTWDRWRH